MAILEDTVSSSMTATTPLTNYLTVVLTDTLSDTVTGGSVFSGSRETYDSAASTATFTSILSALNEMLGEAMSTSTVTGDLSAIQDLSDLLISLVTVSSDVRRNDVAQTWVMNAKTSAFSQYDGYEFKQFFEHQGKYYGVTDAGIFQLDGTTDDGVDIEAYILTGKEDFGSAQLKHVANLYLGAMSDNGMTLTVSIDDGNSYTYNVPYSSQMATKRAILGKGLRSRYWQLALRNVSGGDFEIESMELETAIGRRKLDG